MLTPRRALSYIGYPYKWRSTGTRNDSTTPGRLHPDFNHTLAGACNEVYNLQPRPGDVERPLEMNITVSDATGWRDASWVDWQVNEGLPQCAGSGFDDISLLTSYGEGWQTARLVAK